MKVETIEPAFVESFPDELEPGTLYVSARFSTAAHLCACGCGSQVITPLSPAQWTVILNGAISVRPSIGNWVLPCQSHYFIDSGRIRWAKPFSDREIRDNQAADARALEPALRPSWVRRLLATLGVR